MPIDVTFTTMPFAMKLAVADPVYSALPRRVSPRSLTKVRLPPCLALSAFRVDTNTCGSNRSPSWLPMVTMVGARLAKASIIARSIMPGGDVIALRKLPASNTSPLTMMRITEFGLLLMMLSTAASSAAV